MFAVDFVLKNGKKVEALVWRWSPSTGEIEVLDESNGKISKVKLADLTEGVIYSDRIRKVSKTEDLFDRARCDGWVG